LRVATALRHRQAAQGGQQPGTPPTVSADLMNRIPDDTTAYQRWQNVWADLRAGATDLREVAQRHKLSRRQVQWIRKAGLAGLLNSPIPPALRPAPMVDNGNHPAPHQTRLATTNRSETTPRKTGGPRATWPSRTARTLPPKQVDVDPLFMEKVVDVVGLYLDPPAGAVVLSVDEKAQIQALNRSQPVLPMPGMPERRTHD
jgi:hypothetical protein